MASSITFSPDAVLGGPIVHALRGKLCGFPSPCAIDKGQVLFYGKAKDDGSNAFALLEMGTLSLNNKRMVVAAEAVQVYVSETHVSIPVIVSGRCDLQYESPTSTFSKQSEEFLLRPGQGASEHMRFRFIHAGTQVSANKKTTVDVYMEKFGR